MATLKTFKDSVAWVGWAQGTRQGQLTKIPYDPKTGSLAKTDDPLTWATYDEALKWAHDNHAGVGLVLGEICGKHVNGIDLDACRDNTTGEITPWGQAVIDRFQSYAEISPSELGVKVFFLADPADATAIEALFNGQFGRVFKNGAGGAHPPAIEVYRSNRYFTVTGRIVGKTKSPRQVAVEDLEWLINKHGPAFAGRPGNKPKDQSRSAKAFRAGAAMKAAGATYEQMRDALLDHADDEIAEWAQEKGLPNGERELKRIYDRSAACVIGLGAPYDTARLFQRGLITPLKRHRGGFFEWNGAAWPTADEAMLRARLYAFLDRCQHIDETGRRQPVKPHTLMVNAVVDALCAVAQLDAGIAPPAWLDGANGPPVNELVACLNGLLHLPSLTLTANTPAFFNHNALDFPYDAAAPEPRQWLKFLGQLWPKDREAVDTLQEIFGYYLTSDTSQQKAFLLLGPRRSGKGTIARILVAMLGVYNCAAPTLASLETNFGLEPLIGKRAAIVSDARLSRRVDQHVITERILSITGEDPITVGRKYKQAWTGRLQTRLMILSNELFRLADASGALASRFILLTLSNTFYGREDPTLTAKLTTELPGILNWAIAGWARLRARGYFKQPASSTEAIKDLEDLASPIGAFLGERCEIGPAYSTSVDEMYEAWRTWCRMEGRDHPGTRQSFGRDLRAALPGLKMIHPRVEGKPLRAYQGLWLKPADDAAEIAF